MIAIFCGDRVWRDYDLILVTMKRLVVEDGLSLVIEGEAHGADNLSRIAAEELGIEVKPFRADWKRYGRAAGPIRNGVQLLFLLDHEDQDKRVIAFHDDLDSSKGTKDMVNQAREKGVSVEVIKHYAS